MGAARGSRVGAECSHFVVGHHELIHLGALHASRAPEKVSCRCPGVHSNPHAEKLQSFAQERPATAARTAAAAGSMRATSVCQDAAA